LASNLIKVIIFDSAETSGRRWSSRANQPAYMAAAFPILSADTAPPESDRARSHIRIGQTGRDVTKNQYE